MKTRVQGGALVFFPPAFFQRKPGSPAGVGGALGALRPKVASEPPTQRVRTPLRRSQYIPWQNNK